MSKTLQVVTLGCSKNSVDTEHLLARLAGSYDILPQTSRGKADVLLVNTCGFIGDAKEQSIQAILAAAQRKMRGDVGRLIVFGCLSQRYLDTLPGLIPEVDAWFGARDLAPVAEALGCKWEGSGRYGVHRSYAFMKISEGCDRRCAYCAIPFIRGAHKSVPIELLVAEARTMAAEGVKELILIAQDTTYYGLDLYHRRALAELLDALSEVEGIEWIRIHYSYPADFPEDVLDRMASNPKICRYLDIPLQHVSDKVLEKMHRGVDGAWTRELVKKIREKVPGVVLRTTMIVGHPYEGKRDFEELLDFVREARFERLGAFAYSREEGTFAGENYRNTVSSAMKQARLARLMEVQREISLAFNSSRVGTRVKVLVDAFHDGMLICRSEYESPEADGEILVKYDPVMGGGGAEDLVGRFIEVTLTHADDYDLIGEYVK